MSTRDGTSPPVLFVVGTAGAGKSSLVTAFQRWARFLEVEALTINLDPGAERVHYDPEFDVRDLISLSEVMDEYDLGTNGAQILAADLVAAQAIDIHEELDGLSPRFSHSGQKSKVADRSREQVVWKVVESWRRSKQSAGKATNLRRKEQG